MWVRKGWLPQTFGALPYVRDEAFGVDSTWNMFLLAYSVDG